FFAEHAFMLMKHVRVGAHKEGVHISVDASMVQQRLQADEIRLVGVAEARTVDESTFPRILVARGFKAGGFLVYLVQDQLRRYLVPPGAERQVPVVQMDLAG